MASSSVLELCVENMDQSINEILPLTCIAYVRNPGRDILFHFLFKFLSCTDKKLSCRDKMSEQDIILYKHMGNYVYLKLYAFLEIINFCFRQRVKVQLRVVSDKIPNNLFIRKYC